MVEVIFPWRCGLVVMGDAVAPIENLELSTQDFGLCDDLQTGPKAGLYEPLTHSVHVGACI